MPPADYQKDKGDRDEGEEDFRDTQSEPEDPANYKSREGSSKKQSGFLQK